MGVFHPVLVHLPIGCLLLAILFELVAYRNSMAQFSRAVPFTLFMGFGFALLSCLTGQTLAGQAAYAAETLQYHRWGAWIVTGISGVLGVWKLVLLRTNANQKHWFTAGMLGLGLLLTLTGHLGGSLTHGSQFLTLTQASPQVQRVTTTKTQATLSTPIPKVNPDLPQSLDSNLVLQLRQTGCNVRLLLRHPVMLDVTLPAQSGVKMAQLEPLLSGVAPSIVWLNLADNGFHEKDLTVISQMKNLEKIRLEKNPVGDGIVAILQPLKHLEAVNLNETQVSESAVAALQQQGLRRVYHWNSKPQGVH